MKKNEWSQSNDTYSKLDTLLVTFQQIIWSNSYYVIYIRFLYENQR